MFTMRTGKRSCNRCLDNLATFQYFLLILSAFQIASAQRNSLSGGSDNGPSNYKDALLVYPTGIRSERDLPVCPSLAVEEEGSSKDVGPSFSPGLSTNLGFGGNDLNKLQQPSSTKNPSESSKKSEPKSLAACNIIHKRYFYPPMIERLCRCPDRTECPMVWSQPPQYKDLVRSNKDGSTKQQVSTTPSTKFSNTMDPFTVMISSRSQLKFCTEVSANLPTCEKQSRKDTSPEDTTPSMMKTIKKTFIAPELPSVSLNCYCPPLYRGWKYLSKNELTEQSNGTEEVNYFYRCDRLRKCKAEQQCGAIRTDFHFSYYHCTCPKNHLCVPKVYPPMTAEDIIDGAEEALYSGQVSPAFCTPEQ